VFSDQFRDRCLSDAGKSHEHESSHGYSLRAADDVDPRFAMYDA
jgi:hypothetical protein